MIFEKASRIPAYQIPKTELRESFTYRGDKELHKLAAKVARVMARKAGLEAYVGSSPYYFSPRGSSDEYMSYLVLTDNENLSFRVTFAIEGDSTRITSFELYKGIKELDDPDITVSILDPNINIVQLVNALGDKMLKAEAEPEDIDDVEGMISEAGKRGTFLQRLKENDKKDAIIDFLKTEGGGYTQYVRWATANNRPPAAQGTFSRAKAAFEGGGGKSPSGSANAYSVKPSEPEEPLYDPQDADAFEEMEEEEALEKFDEYETMCRKMAHNDPNVWALFVYGSPGIGKSHTVKKVFYQEETKALKETGQEVVMKTGGIAGSTGLLALLHEHKKGYILVLDDNDEILKNQTAANYLKGALNTDIEDRHITYSRADFSELFAQEDEEEEFDEDEIEDDEAAFEDDLEENSHIFVRDGRAIFETATKRVDLGAVNEKNLTEARDEDGESIRDFYFRSRIIFISNLLEVPEAVDDRCYSIDMIFSYEQILELIESVMDKIEIENVPREMKLEVYNFLKRNRYAIERKLNQTVILTFRKFRNACIAWEAAVRAGKPKKYAKKWAYKQLRGTKKKGR